MPSIEFTLDRYLQCSQAALQDSLDSSSNLILVVSKKNHARLKIVDLSALIANKDHFKTDLLNKYFERFVQLNIISEQAIEVLHSPKLDLSNSKVEGLGNKVVTYASMSQEDYDKFSNKIYSQFKALQSENIEKEKKLIVRDFTSNFDAPAEEKALMISTSTNFHKGIHSKFSNVKKDISLKTWEIYMDLMRMLARLNEEAYAKLVAAKKHLKKVEAKKFNQAEDLKIDAEKAEDRKNVAKLGIAL